MNSVIETVAPPVQLLEKLIWLRKGATAVADQGLLSGSSFLISVFLARQLSAEEYGAYALAFSIFLFISSFHNGLLLEPMSVFGPASYADRLRSYLGTLFRLHFALCLPMSLMLALGVFALDRFVGRTATRPALLGVSLAMPFILLFWLWRKAAYLEFEPARAVQGAVTYCATALGLLLLLRRLEWLSPFSTFLLLGCASLVASAVITISLRFDLAPGGELAVPMNTIVREHWEYGRWVIMGTVVYWLSGGAYYVVVGGLLGMKEAAALRALQNFVLPVTQFITAIGVLLLPWLSGRYARTDTSSFKRTIRAVNFLFVASAMAYVAALLLAGRWLLDLLYKGKYSQVAYLLPLVALPMLLSAASQGTAMALRVMQAPADVFWGYAGGGAVTIVAGVVLTRAWGLAGALVGLSASSLVFFSIVTVLYRRRMEKVVENASYD
jgi:O-antigen/teichoic acid export membrane protein